MNMQLKEDFIRIWKKYFNNAELPITFYYTNEGKRAELAKPVSAARCVIGSIVKVRAGKSFTFGVESVGCFGGKRYLGFSENSENMEAFYANIDYFLSCGLPGKVEGERFKKTPEICKEMYRHYPEFKAPSRYIVFKRWDMLDEKDTPEVIIFFTKPDILAGLYGLANYDTTDPNGVIAPWGSGCSSIVQGPYLEKDNPNPRAIVGMFDISARPFVAPDELCFSIPMKKFTNMLDNMEESFLITKCWKLVQKRIK